MSKQKMNKKRLLKWAEFLETEVPPKRFDMGVWGTGPLSKCSTAACALGWATAIPSFRRAGLTTLPTFDGGFAVEYRSNDGSTYGASAAEQFFGIRSDDAALITDPAFYSTPPTPKQVAKRIRKLVAEAA